MSGGSEILVKARLGSIQSRFFACGEMWNGIKVRSGGSIVFQSNSEIEDAINAIDLTDESSFNSITQTTFNRNQTGIYLHSATNSLSKAINFNSFYKNVFSCSSKLNNNLWASVGISASSVNVPTLGWASQANIQNKAFTNLFIGKIGTGINSAYSILNIRLCKFVDVQDGANLNSGGIGIDAYASKIYFLGLGVPTVPNASYSPNPDNATFFNCRRGAIRANSTSLDVQQTYFEFSHSPTADLGKVANVIESSNNVSSEVINIENNYFNLFLRSSKGIKISRSEGICRINFNKFTFVDLGSVANSFDPFINCIFTSVGSSKTSACYINVNKIYCQALNMTVFGIIAQQGKNYFINQNIIDKLPNLSSSGSTGIFMDRCGVPSTLSLNEVTGFEDPLAGPVALPSSIGYRIFNTSIGVVKTDIGNLRVCSNKVKHCKEGFLFIGLNERTVFADNEMTRNKAYLILREDNSTKPSIGKQSDFWFYRKNTYASMVGSSFGGDIAICESGNPRLSQFIVDTRQKASCGAFECSKVAFERIGVPSGYTKEDWFADGGTNDVGCVETPPNLTFNSIDEAILNGEFDEDNAVTLWEAQRMLFQKLTDNPELLDGYPERQAFYANFENTNMPIFNEIQRGIATLFELTEAQQSEIAALKELEDSDIAHWVAFAEESNSQFGENSWDSDAIATFAIMSETLAGRQTDIENSQISIAQTIATKLQELKQINQSIEPQISYEIDAKNANKYWLRHIETKGNLSSEELAGVRVLAAKCFYEAGTAKYQTMDILPIREATSYFGTGCDAPIGRIAKINTNVVHDLRVAPNPTSDVVRIDAQNWTNVKVFDLSGRQMSSLEQTAGNNATLDVSTWLNGIYLLQVTYKDGATKVAKVSIMH